VKRFILNCLISGAAGGIVSHVAASVRGRIETGRSELPMHAVSHIAWGDAPESHKGRTLHNKVIGTALHHGACFFWSPFFEALFGKRAERSTPAALVGGATIATAAYITDYHIVSDRFKPGFDAYLSNRSMFLVYAGLALGLAAAARLRGLCNHQVEDDDERKERRESQRGPDVVEAPETRR
jgi:hypothetical protein